MNHTNLQIKFPQATSHRHHYIPQFFLKGFTNEKGTFYIYEKKLDKINPKRKETSSYFYEKDRNCFFLNGIQTDIIEKNYSRLDSIASPLFEEIRNGVSEKDLFSKDILPFFKQYLALFFLRLPILDPLIKPLISSIDFSKTRNILIAKGENFFGNPNEIQSILNDEGKLKFFRSFILPSLLFDYKSVDSGEWHLFECDQSFNRHVCSDIPVLFNTMDINKILSFNCDFVMSISKNILLVHTMKKNINKEKVPPQFVTYFDLLTLWQSQKFVACPEKNYLNELVMLKKDFQVKYSFHEISSRFFSFLYLD